jgi:hypothetical protein
MLFFKPKICIFLSNNLLFVVVSEIATFETGLDLAIIVWLCILAYFNMVPRFN